MGKCGTKDDVQQRYGKPQLSGKSGKYCRLKEAGKTYHFLFNKGI